MRAKFQAPTDIQAAALFVALMLHGLFSSPAPASPGVAEGMIALLLALSILPHAPAMLNGAKLTQQPSAIAWWCLLLVPLGIGLYSGSLVRDWFRDIIAILFLGLPVLVGGISPKHIRPLAMAVSVTGTMLAARYWMITGASLDALHNLKNGDGLLYLSLDPTILFAAIYLPIQIVEMSGKSIRAWAIRTACLVGAFLCWGALGGMQMRGALGLGLLALSAYALFQSGRPWIPLAMAMLAILITALFWSELSRILIKLWEKQQSVGLNARDDDLAAIWKILAADPIKFLFGAGWGALYSSPAVGGYWVNYSHSALGFFLLKTGILGLMVAAAYVGLILRSILVEWRAHLSLLLAALPPVFLSFSIYTSYKFLSCGIILLLLGSLNAHSDPEPG